MQVASSRLLHHQLAVDNQLKLLAPLFERKGLCIASEPLQHLAEIAFCYFSLTDPCEDGIGGCRRRLFLRTRSQEKPAE